jgi:1-acyl-sn-glycerol-3-phosphate acyltransferase
MTFTIFDTPVLHPLMRRLSAVVLRLLGWRVEGRLPASPKFVLIGAPHTSNWDLPLTLLTAFALDAKIYWLGKQSIFRPPFRRLFQWLGGLPIDRDRAGGVVAQCVAYFRQNEQLILTVAPAGTRKRVLRWKTGFYRIAVAAGVPVAMGFMDYRRKSGGIGPVLHPTGDLPADMTLIRRFYRTVTGKHPHQSVSGEE